MKNLKKLLEERLTSIEAAYNETGLPKVDFTVYPESMREHEEGDYNAKVIVEAARKIERECGLGELDWEDPSQYKYTPWFRMRPSGFAFWGSFYGCTNACAGAGSRLRVLSEIASDHIGKTFPEVWGSCTNEIIKQGCLPWTRSPSGFAFKNSNYDNTNANAGTGSHNCQIINQGKGHAPWRKITIQKVLVGKPNAPIRNKGMKIEEK